MPVARRSRSWTLPLRLIPAVVFLIALGSGDASAAHTPDDHAAVCNCGMSCRPGACCCGPKKKKAEPRPEPRADSPAVPAAEAPDDACGPTGPCLGAAPCGDDVAAPVKTATVGSGKACLDIGAYRTGDRGDRLPPPSSDLPGRDDASRLERPPKADPAA